MKPTLTPKEAQINLTFLNRVDLKGAEAEAMAFLKSKLAAVAAEKRAPEKSENVTDFEGTKGHGTGG